MIDKRGVVLFGKLVQDFQERYANSDDALQRWIQIAALDNFIMFRAVKYGTSEATKKFLDHVYCTLIIKKR